MIVFLASLLATATYAHPRAVLGSDLASNCSIDKPDDFCAGFAAAVDAENGDRFLARPCPPPLVQYNPGATAARIRKYLAVHPESLKRLARDVIFDEETEEVSAMLGQDCRPRR